MSLDFYGLLPYYGVPERIVRSLKLHYHNVIGYYDVDQVPSEVAKYQAKEWLFIHGPTGAGKSTLAAFVFTCWLTQRGRIQGWATALNRLDPNSQSYDNTYRLYGARDEKPYYMYVRVADLMSQMKADFDSHTGKGFALFRKCVEAEFLVLDDLTDQPSPWELRQLDTLIDVRYGDMSRTVITSNYSVDTLAGVLSERIARRIGEASQIEVLQELR